MRIQSVDTAVVIYDLYGGPVGDDGDCSDCWTRVLYAGTKCPS